MGSASRIYIESERATRVIRYLSSQVKIAGLIFIPLGMFNLSIGYKNAALLDIFAFMAALAMYLCARRGFGARKQVAFATIYLMLFVGSITLDGASGLYWGSLMMAISFLIFLRAIAVSASIVIIVAPFFLIRPDDYYPLALYLASQSFLLVLLVQFSRIQHMSDERMIASTLKDALTGSLNRKAFEADLEVIAQNGAPAKYCVALLDIDHFKAINDVHGHAAGDRCLTRFSKAAREALSDLPMQIYRYGGEEFAILSSASLSDTFSAIESLRVSIAETSLLRERRVTFSAGISAMDPDESPAQAVQRADKALYSAKNTGRNRVEVAAGGKVDQMRATLASSYSPAAG